MINSRIDWLHVFKFPFLNLESKTRVHVSFVQQVVSWQSLIKTAAKEINSENVKPVLHHDITAHSIKKIFQPLKSF